MITGGVPSRDVAKPLVDEAITTILITCPGASMLFCVRREALWFEWR